MSQTSLNISFWLLAVLTAYSYFLYPVILLAIRPFADRRRAALGPRPATYQEPPLLSVIVAAHNEADRIRGKLENLLSLEYDGKLEIIVASDASTDATDRIVAEFAPRGVTLARNAAHDGKEAAQQLAISRSRGEIIVFSDVATEMRGDVLNRIATHFQNEQVGALSSTDCFIDRDGRTSGEGAYVRYEMFVRRLESRVHSLIGLSGSFFAVRADICKKHWATDIPSDFMAAINCAVTGYRAIAADDVMGYYHDISDPGKEYQRKVRTVLRGMKAMMSARKVLDLRKYGLFAFEVFSHKIMRWLTPWFLLPLLLVNLAIADQHLIYRTALALQIMIYVLFSVGAIWTYARTWSIVRIPYYFGITNIAVTHAALLLLRGKTVVTWVPSER